MLLWGSFLHEFQFWLRCSGRSCLGPVHKSTNEASKLLRLALNALRNCARVSPRGLNEIPADSVHCIEFSSSSAGLSHNPKNLTSRKTCASLSFLSHSLSLSLSLRVWLKTISVYLSPSPPKAAISRPLLAKQPAAIECLAIALACLRAARPFQG